MRTSSTCPALAPFTATGPVQMWPGIFCGTLLWIAASAGGTASGAAGIWLAMPETVEIVTVSPLVNGEQRLQPRVEVAPVHRLRRGIEPMVRHMLPRELAVTISEK